MNMKILQKLAQQHIAQLHFVDSDINDSVEGECLMGQQEDCTFLLDFADLSMAEHDVVAILKTITTQLTWLAGQRECALNQLRLAQPDLSLAHVQWQYVAFFVENADAIYCDFALMSPEWGEQSAEFALESDGSLQFNGLN